MAKFILFDPICDDENTILLIMFESNNTELDSERLENAMYNEGWDPSYVVGEFNSQSDLVKYLKEEYKEFTNIELYQVYDTGKHKIPPMLKDHFGIFWKNNVNPFIHFVRYEHKLLI